MIERDLSGERDNLPISALLILAATGFSAIVTETLPAGLLPQVAADFDIGRGAAGQMVSVYALGSVVAAIPLVTATQGWERRRLLLIALTLLVLGNLLTALSHSYVLALGARLVAGVAAGLGWGMLGGYARRMVVDRLKGRALALAMTGTPLALAAGVPLCTFAGGMIGWRAALLALTGALLLLMLVVVLVMPATPGQAATKHLSNRDVLKEPGVAAVLATAAAWVTAHYALYTYVAPFAAWAGMGSRVSLLLLVFGIAALAGIWIAALAVDHHLRVHVLGSLIAFAAATAALAYLHHPLVLFGAIALWGLTFGGAATSIQTAASDAAGEGVDLVGAMLTTTWNLSIAGGGALGALLLAHGGMGAVFPAMLALIAVALVLAMGSATAGFRKGARTTHGDQEAFGTLVEKAGRR